MRWLIIISGLLLLGACATLNENECRDADWFQVGFEDGKKGRALGFFARHQKACQKHGVTPKEWPWREGRDEGLRLFCVPEKAYFVGRRGSAFPSVCTPAETVAMRPAWDWGRSYYEYSKDIDQYEDLIDEMEDAIEGFDDEDDPIVESYRIEILKARISIRRLERRRAKYSSWPI